MKSRERFNMEEKDYPAQYQSSDAASASTQKGFLRYSRAQLTIICIVAAIGGFSYTLKIGDVNVFVWLITLLIIINLIISLVDRSRGSSETWFACRTIAESTKKIVWQYMMGAGPYDYERDEKEVEKEFLKQLEAIRQENKEATEAMSCHPSSGGQITENMREMRKKDWKDKLNFYKEYRLEDQKKWYQDKANFNKNREKLWFRLGFVLQIATILAGFILLLNSANYNPIGLFMTLAATAIAWSQLKRHKELAISYGSIAYQLTSMGDLLVHVSSQDDLAEHVFQVEEAISKEHTYWKAMML